MADDVSNKLYTYGNEKENLIHPQTLLSPFSAFPIFVPQNEKNAIGDSIAGKHLMDDIRAEQQTTVVPFI
eukprot:3590039-Heterocapsa_arctica.AAC.1